MTSAVDLTSKEASTAGVTRSCLEEFQQCIQQLEGEYKTHIQTRLADLRLWADSVGATAQAKASLDSRFQHRPDDIYFIRELLSMLQGFLKECFAAANNKFDVRDIITNIDSTVDSLALIGVEIRRSGRKSRLRKADDSFDQNRDRYRKLRAHLACVITSKPTKEGRPKDESNGVHSADYFSNMKLQPIQERLVEANLRRRHRFMEAQRHSHGLKDPSMKAFHTIIPQKFITMAAVHTAQEVSPMQDKKVAATMLQKQAANSPRKDTPTIPTTSASGLDSKWGGLQNKRRPGSTVTRITAITAAAKYPKAKTSSNLDQKLIKCPCCCQAIPATELEDSQWRKHVANDLCPYTCILENCPTPYNIFVTQNEWKDHVLNEHPPQWQCPCCEDDPPMFESLSGITGHLMSEHLDIISDDIGDLLSAAEINVMGITKCYLCDSEGPQDSPDLVEHVLQHVHDFSLRSLPWPTDPTISLSKSIGTFDVSRAVNIIKDDKSNENISHIAEWAESVVPTFDLSRGVIIVNDPEGNELALDIAEFPKNTRLKGELSLQLSDFDRKPSTESEEESSPSTHFDNDYFSQNDYFKDGSSDGRFSSQTSHSSQDTQNTVRSSGKQQPKEWICTLCNLRSPQGDDAYFRHLESAHSVEIEAARILPNCDVEQWKRSMLNEAYWNGFPDELAAIEDSDLPSFNMRLSETDDEGGSFRTENYPLAASQEMSYTEHNKGFYVHCSCVDIVHGWFSSGSDLFASLIVLQFRFDTQTQRRRVMSTDISMEFMGMDSGEVGPEVFNIAPDGRYALYEVEYNQSFANSVTASAEGIMAGGTVRWEKNFRKDRSDHAMVIGSIDLIGRNWGPPNCASWTLLENKTTKTGVPISMRTAVLLKRKDKDIFKLAVKIDTEVDQLSGLKRLLGRKRRQHRCELVFDPKSKSTENLQQYDLRELGAFDLGSVCDFKFATSLRGME